MRGTLATGLLGLAYLLVLFPDAVRIPALIGHYVEHKDHSPDLSVADFLDLHYGNKDHSGNGDAPHEQLPFRHHHLVGDNCSPSAIAVTTVMPGSMPPMMPNTSPASMTRMLNGWTALASPSATCCKSP